MIRYERLFFSSLNWADRKKPIFAKGYSAIEKEKEKKKEYKTEFLNL